MRIKLFYLVVLLLTLSCTKEKVEVQENLNEKVTAELDAKLLPLYKPLVNADFRANTIHIAVRLAANETLGVMEKVTVPVKWSPDQQMIAYKIPVVPIEESKKSTATSKEYIRYIEIKDVEHLLSPDKKKLGSNLVGFLVRVYPQDLLNSKKEGEPNEGDDGGGNTGVIWSNGLP